MKITGEIISQAIGYELATSILWIAFAVTALSLCLQVSRVAGQIVEEEAEEKEEVGLLGISAIVSELFFWPAILGFGLLIIRQAIDISGCFFAPEFMNYLLTR